MVFFNKIFSKLLSKSGSYNFYKNNYENLTNQNKKLKNCNENLSADLKKLKMDFNLKSKNLILNKLENKQYDKLNIAIKSPNPSNARYWGDYFFALALKKAFEKKGFNVYIHEHDFWYSHNQNIDINIILRGLYEYIPNDDEINVMWNIYVPENMELTEYENFDIVFIASEYYANEIENKVDTIVKPLLQCTDPEVFYPEFDEECCEDILFVGVPRGVYREIIKDMMSTNFDVSIYGLRWEDYVDEKYIKGQFIQNEELHKYYSSCKILLNDHLQTMKDLDFPSNRFFDALACGTFIISDKINVAETLFEGTIVTYEGAEDLNNKIEYYLSHDDEREKIAKKGKELVLKNHTFDNRVKSILKCLNKLNGDIQ